MTVVQWESHIHTEGIIRWCAVPRVCSQWQGGKEGRDDCARLLVLKGLGGKAFCAGGDVKAVAEE